MKGLAKVSKKQVNVIYSAWRNGSIEASKSLINAAYRFAEAGGRDGSGYLMKCLDKALLDTVDAIFSGDFAKAQASIEAFAAADAESKREWAEIEARKARLAAAVA